MNENCDRSNGIERECVRLAESGEIAKVALLVTAPYKSRCPRGGKRARGL